MQVRVQQAVNGKRTAVENTVDQLEDIAVSAIKKKGRSSIPIGKTPSSPPSTGEEEGRILRLNKFIKTAVPYLPHQPVGQSTLCLIHGLQFFVNERLSKLPSPRGGVVQQEFKQ